MAEQYSEKLFESIDIIANSAIQKISLDKTILCTVEDNAHAKEGKYTVSNDAARFEAYSQDTNYRIGQNVWVLIPEGDYNKDKLIISKYTKDDASPYVYVDPMHSFANVTGNVLQAYDFTETANTYAADNSLIASEGLHANYSVFKDIFSGEKFAENSEPWQPAEGFTIENVLEI